MSERMVELQRARLGLPPAASTAPTPSAAAQRQTTATGTAGTRPAVARQPSQQLVAAATLRSEDEQLRDFLQKVASKRSDSGPTVPTALSRRMLQRQGVSYLDDTVAALTSAAADRFLATVLQQGVACRDRRCKGVELAKDEAIKRRKHISLYRQDADDRKRRKIERDSKKLKSNLATVAAAKQLTQKQQGNDTTAADGSKKPASKKKKKPVDAEDNNGKKKKDFIGDEEQLDDDSLDDEEQYYDEYYGDFVDYFEDDEEEQQDDFMLLLRDLERPLEAWHFKLTGKVGLGAIPMEVVESATGASGMEDDQDEADFADETAEMNGENGESNGNAAMRTKSPKPSPTKGGDSSAPESMAASRAATPMALAISPGPK